MIPMRARFLRLGDRASLWGHRRLSQSSLIGVGNDSPRGSAMLLTVIPIASHHKVIRYCQSNDNLTYESGAEQMVIPLSESAVTRRMEELNAQAAGFAQNGIGAFPIPDDKVTREAAVRIW